MLKIEQISSGYGKKQVLFDITLEIKQGEIVLLTGGNGSGKSTLLKCIYNLIPLWKGKICFEGERIDHLKPSDLIKKGIVYIPQKDFCFESLTVDDNLRIAGNIYNKIELKNRLDNVYEQIGLYKFKNRKPFNLSGGEKKLLAFGMGLVHKPKIFLFDEPLAGTDAHHSQQIIEIFSTYLLMQNISAIIVEHRKDDKMLHTLINKPVLMNLGTIQQIN